jgi:hypothetical protein
VLTDAHGDARLALTGPMWLVTTISKPGYATSCPISSTIATRHRLFQDDENEKTCLLVPRSAFVVSDGDTAIRRARDVPAVAAWLRDHPDARAGSTTSPPEFEVHFTVDSLAHPLDATVIVDAIDGSAIVERL